MRPSVPARSVRPRRSPHSHPSRPNSHDLPIPRCRGSLVLLATLLRLQSGAADGERNSGIIRWSGSLSGAGHDRGSRDCGAVPGQGCTNAGGRPQKHRGPPVRRSPISRRNHQDLRGSRIGNPNSWNDLVHRSNASARSRRRIRRCGIRRVHSDALDLRHSSCNLRLMGSGQIVITMSTAPEGDASRVHLLTRRRPSNTETRLSRTALLPVGMVITVATYATVPDSTSSFR